LVGHGISSFSSCLISSLQPNEDILMIDSNQIGGR
jgi:hypothetical protein